MKLKMCAFRSGITKSKALEIAKAEVDRRGLSWDEPVWVRRRWRSIVVWTNANWLGGNIVVHIDSKNGEITHFNVTSR